MRILRQSTSVDVPVGPFVDQTDGFTAETALTITQPDVRLKKNGGNWAQKAAAQTLSHEENGNYEVTLDTTDTDTLGQLRLHIAESGALPVWDDFTIVPAAVYDALVSGSGTGLRADVISLAGSAISQASGLINANVTQMSGDSVAADNIESEFDGTGFAGYVRRATAQAGAAGSITLDASAVATDNTYNGMSVKIVAGTGVGQSRVITAYVGSTRVATVVPNWVTNPSTDSVFVLNPAQADVEAWLRAAPAALVSGLVDASADVTRWRGTQPNVLSGSRVDSFTGAMGTDVVTATAIAADAIGSSELAASAATEIATAILAAQVEAQGTYTLQQAISIILAALAGVTSSGGATIATPNGVATRIAATINGSNERTAMTLTPSA